MTEGASTLDKMIQEISTAPEIYKPSAFWKQLGDLNLEQLKRRGYQHFKQTVNQNYFNWLPTKWNDNQFINVRRFWHNKKSLWPFLLRFNNPNKLELFNEKNAMCGWKERCIYKLFVGMLWEYARQEDPERLLDKLEEPNLGTPLEIKRGFRRISQDLANSVLERNVIMRHVNQAEQKTIKVAELGAGYGRLAYVFLKTTSCRFFIFDIPPALDLSQWYLSKLFPNHRIFRFRHFNNYQEIQEELAQCDLAFFSPNQLEMFPDDAVDIFVTISSLHEMKMDQIHNFMALMQRISQKLLFIKQWFVGENSFDNITVQRNDYVLENDWNILLDAPDPVQDLFFTLIAEKQALPSDAMISEESSKRGLAGRTCQGSVAK